MTAVETPFYFFFGLLGLVAGALIVWFLMAERPFERPEVEGGPVDSLEAPLIVAAMKDDGIEVSEATVAQIVAFHQAYFQGRIYDSLAAAEEARISAERARLAAEEEARREAARARRTQRTPKSPSTGQG